MSDVEKQVQGKQIPDTKPKWYVIHTYSGYENKVKTNIEKLVENRGIQNLIQEVSVPVEDVVEIKNGKKKVVSRKLYPGYVLVKMIKNDETWYVVRNTRGVTSFVGPGSEPIPLTDAEVASMGIEPVVVEELDIEVGDSVTIVNSSTFSPDTVGVVKEINLNKRVVKVAISMFGRETPIELGFNQVQPLN